MISYFWWALAVLVIAATIALVIFAFRAGDNSQGVQSSKRAAEDADAAAAVQASMAKAQAEGPQDKDQLLARLDNGNA